MKNFYLLLVSTFMSLIAYGQVIITEIADPNDNALARYVEIYNVSGGDVDLTGWELRRWTNGNAGPQATGIDLSSVGILGSNSFVLVAASAAEFLNVYGVAADIDGGTAGAADSNGDDQIAIFDAADNTIDIFGVPGEDGTGTCHEFEDGRAERIESVSASNPVWDEAEWNVWADSPVTGCTSHTSQPVNTGDGIYDPGVWIGETSGTGPQINTTENGINGFIQFIGAPSPEQFFGASGSNLIGDIVMTVSGDFEISLTSGTGFTNSLVLPQTGGEVSLTQVFVRLNGSVAGPVQEEIFLSDGGDTATVLLAGEILSPDPTILTSLDTLDGFSHFVGTPSASQSFDISGNYLTEDLLIEVNGEFQISDQPNGSYGNTLSIPSNYNATVFDANATWLGYMNVFELPENGGGFVFGSGWGLADLQSIITPATNSVKLLPNVNTYADNPTDPFWVNQTTQEGNKTMEANTFVEPGASANDNDLTFAGNVVSNTLDSAYTATYFIKALDPNNGFADAFGGSKTFDLPANGEFSVSATAAELPAGLIVQYGFTVTGPNADPAVVGTLGSVVVNGDFETGAVQSTPVYVRLNGAAQNLNQVGVVSASSAGAASAEVLLLGETLDYIVSSIGDVTSNNVDGVAESLGDFVQLQGVVHCIDFDGNDGYSFTIIDENNDGINVFSFSDVSGYVVNEGDEIIVTGQIEQYNGLTEVVPDSIIVIAADMPTVSPTIVTALDESTESQWITIENLDFVTPIATFPTGSNNIDVTDGTNVYTIRVDSDTDIPGTNTPQAPFSVTGVGGQFDNSNPYDSGYQLFPCGTGSFETSPTTGLNEGISNSIIAYPNPFNESISISILNAMDYTVSVFDCNGRIVYSSNISSSDQISTSSWNRGVYIVEMKNELGDSKIQRLIK